MCWRDPNLGSISQSDEGKTHYQPSQELPTISGFAVVSAKCKRNVMLYLCIVVQQKLNNVS